MKLGGVLIPIIAAVLLFQERMKWVQFAGAVLAVAAIVLINMERGDVNKGRETRWLAVLLLSLGSVPAVVAYPVFSVGTIIVISAACAVFFHERLNRRKKGALLLILASLVMLNI